MVVGITAGGLLLVVEHTFAVMDSFEAGRPSDISTLIGLAAPINFSKELVSTVVVGVADTTTSAEFVGRIVGPILEFGKIATGRW